MNTNKKSALRAGILAGILSVSAVAFPFTKAFAADTVEDLQKRINQIEQQMKSNEKKIQQNTADKAEQKQVVSDLESEIEGLSTQIDLLDQKITILNGDIANLNSNIEDLDAEIEDINAQITQTKIDIAMSETTIDMTYQKVLDRLALSYMMGDASGLELMFGAKSLSDILTRKQYMQNAAEYDKQLIDGLEESVEKLHKMNDALDASVVIVNNKKAEVEAQKKDLQAKKADVQSSENDLSTKKYTVNIKRSNAVAMMNTLDKESAEYKRLNKQLQAEKEKVDAEITALIAAQGSSQGDEVPVDIKNDGTLIWPVPYKNCYISAYYPAYSDGSPHHGIDICVSGGTEGKNVIAAQSGKAMTVGYGHWSMGNYIILDHGNGLFTAYYHLSSINISQGQTVKQGQVIGHAGHTGNTTGPHLHFEVRTNKNGTVTRCNPLNYVSKP